MSKSQAALEEPHDNDVMGQGHGVFVEPERVGVGEGDGEHRHVVGVDERVEQLGQSDQGGEELQHRSRDAFGGRYL